VHAALCQKHDVRGYPTITVFKKDGKKEPYNGGRDFNSLVKFTEANLAGPSCSLEAKEDCDKASLKILEESEAMSTGDRHAKIKEIEGLIKEKKKEAKDLEKEAKKMAENLILVKLGGDKPEKVEQILGDEEFQAHCDSRVCVVAFLPHILDGGAAARNDALKIINEVFNKNKAAGTPVGFGWVQGGDQFEMEEKLSLQFGFPAVIAIHTKKGKFGVHRGTFDKDGVSGFISSLMTGRVPLAPLPAGVKFPKATPWDGKDGEMPQEEL